MSLVFLTLLIPLLAASIFVWTDDLFVVFLLYQYTPTATPCVVRLCLVSLAITDFNRHYELWLVKHRAFWGIKHRLKRTHDELHQMFRGSLFQGYF